MQKRISMLNVKMNSKVKSSFSALLLTAFMLLTTGFTSNSTSTLEKCLDEQPNEIRECLGKTSKYITLSTCFDQVSTIKSNFLKENVREYCFYHISEFPNLKSCVAKARQFTDAENHDAALFNCYSQFEPTIKRSTCETMSKMFRFPEKGRYLKSNCRNLN